MKNLTKKQIVIHNDFYEFMGDYESMRGGVDDPAYIGKAAVRQLSAGADIVSVCVANPESCYYFPADVGEVSSALGGFCGAPAIEKAPLGAVYDAECKARDDLVRRVLTEAGVDPFGAAVQALRKDGCTVLAKLRVNDRHHVAGYPHRGSQFWRDHPEWRIGSTEAKAGGGPSFQSYSCLGTYARTAIAANRGLLLDYAVPEVREHRLSIVRGFMARYDVDGLTLNFLRTPYCISFPSKNAHHLTAFVAGCRKIVEEAVRRRGGDGAIMGAILPFDLDFCRVMGLDVERWIGDGLLDYVAPTDTSITEFNMAIESWDRLASSTRCAVYPGIIGMKSRGHDVCLPDEYTPEGAGQGNSTVTHENIRALAHGFYAEGAAGVSFFNFMTPYYDHLFPLNDLCLPEHIKGKERRYIYMKRAPLVSEWMFLQLELPPGFSTRTAINCRLHENLKEVEATVRFKARYLADIGSLRVDVNGKEVPADGLSLVPHDGSGFLYVQFPLRDGMLRDGANEIGFALRDGPAAVNLLNGGAFVRGVIIQELEIRVVPG